MALAFVGAFVAWETLPWWAGWPTALGCFAFIGWRVNLARTQGAQQIADSLQFEYVGDVGFADVGNFALLGYPHVIGPGISRMSRGRREGLEVLLFDYSTEFNEFTSAVVIAPGLDVPHFAVQPPSFKGPGVGSRIYRPRLSVPFEFPERPEFNRIYWATADEPSTREVFTPALLDRLQREPGWYLEGLGDRLYVGKTKIDVDGRSKYLEQQEVPGFLDDAMGFFHLVADRRGYARA